MTSYVSDKRWKTMKAQIWSLDFAASVFIFLVVLVAVLFAWIYVNDESRVQLDLRRMEAKALDISDSLVMTAGSPADWSPANVKAIGLAEAEGVLNATKVADLVGMGYEQARLKLGVGLYHFYFRLRNVNNQTISVGGIPAECGIYPSGAEFVVPVQRYVLVNGTAAAMEFMLWV